MFLSNLWRELFWLHGTELKHSTSYHPQKDGQTEIINKTLKTYLRCFFGGQPRSWAKWLAWAEFSNNTSFHMATKFTLFKIVYGRDPPSIIRVGKGLIAMLSIEESLQERDAILDDLQFNLLRDQ